MVHPASDGGVGTPASFVRKHFTVGTVGGAETLRISALGLYRCFINGKRVGEDLLTPGWTSYDKRLSYQTYSVGDLLVAGENLIEIWLADGWYRSQIMWGENAIFNCWGDKIAAIAELRASSDPGDAVLVATDESWTSGLLPILKSGIYFGEVYDARKEAFEETAGVDVLDFDPDRLIAHETQPVRELEPLSPVKTWRDTAGRALYDFGQNSGGYVAFSVKGAAGARVVVEHSEILDKDGQFENANYRTADARLEYVLKGEGTEAFRPYFTFQGFRYARVTIEGEAEILDIVSVPISSVYPRTGTFTSGNALVNRLVENTHWSQRANFIEVPTDCPQRDERLGWTGDAQVFAMTACYLHDSHDFLVKWIRDVMADQRQDGAIPHVSPDPTRLHPEIFPGFYGSTGWGDAIAIVPWALYLHYGDKDILAEALPAMVKWVDFVWSISDGPIVSPPRQWGQRGFSFGDWLQPKGPSAKPLPTIGDEAAATIYLHITASLVGRIARILGEDKTAVRMEEMASAVKAAFAEEFVSASGRIANDDQTSYALAIVHDLVPEDKLEAVRGYFRNAIARAEGRIQTGFIGTPALLPALIKLGETGLAQQVFLQEEVPGWLYQVKNGATTIWERWDAIQEDGSIYNPQMNSYNHYAYGAVCQWLFEAVAGIRPDPEAPGFAHIVFEPVILPELSPVTASYQSAAGEVRAHWRLEEGRVTYEIDVPEGAAGTLRLSGMDTGATLDGTPIETGADVPLGAGRHIVVYSPGALRPGLPKFARSTSRTP
ncbi:alpha-L-rhamnosidase [Pelagibacterium xiamenense]|uniref:alpha-L-rhamnosidase n=1 Tax=Pelagibacterium xiamenense TaxID=2901140 RepID=UPI001E5FB8EB|nr:alpha-L-rhamnosidase [Pelagibacterium xiamenense]MCD7061129.1 glycoside hydrolase family 78 protein [Pelagibacterium xiamenense]